ncbi:NAD(P)H-dependent FMN reductase C4B3.06c [Lachnellula arida]|uniref:NAD(P)H-dependent FMN reductase C4B3.06c n=1 Tax=Lachnellula arida TaxID=1316785 RepID=A0A8T9BK84_9HELO|nr:NAD(P)H-dependent FMN reductase C4B3.06c [Lachnellula arida]
MTTTQTPSIAVIICSTRQPRVCPQIASFVTSTLQTLPSLTSTTATATLSTIDLATWNLPMFNEPTIPSQIKDPSAYAQPHTRAWSVEISKHQAFIFVLPQYNWGYPAVLKNALDYLFHEWAGKPAMVVSYGGHGGGKAAGQLKQVLQGLRMRVLDNMPALTFPGHDAVVAATKGEDIGIGEGVWDGERDGIRRAGEELLGLLAEAEAEVAVGSMSKKGAKGQ